jgi:hypothetical protein
LHVQNEFELVADDIQILIDNLPEGYKLVFKSLQEGFKHKKRLMLGY